jgi:hypothetical protein
MKKMEETKRRMKRHIRSAQQWLDRAERAFDAESPTRGELDLLLARAEMQHAQEKQNGSPKLSEKSIMFISRYKKILGGLAGVVVVTLYLLSYAWSFNEQPAGISAAHSFQPNKQLETPAPLRINVSSSATPLADTRKIISESPNADKAGTSENEVAVITPVNSNASAVRSDTVQGSVVQTQSKTLVSEAELRMLMRTAERALKSTN